MLKNEWCAKHKNYTLQTYFTIYTPCECLVGLYADTLRKHEFTYNNDILNNPIYIQR